MSKNLVIVESPAKAKTLKKFLGNSYKIEASVGHVRDLPKSELGIDVENDFEPKYITIRGKGEILSKLRKEVKNSDKVYLATDPDREGEAISWHLKNALKLDSDKAYRITFNEITKTAVKNAIKEAREINMNLVDAQQARRELDRIVGYSISPLLWKKVKKGLSAGRVQSVTLKLICDREDKISNFEPDEYWTISADLKSSKEKFNAKLVLNTKNKTGKTGISNSVEAKNITDVLEKSEFVVENIVTGKRMKKPPKPFTTSTLQQEASKYLNFATSKTMMLAQQLYEGVEIKGEGVVGLLSYIRTDSTRISDEAYSEVHELIISQYGKEYANEKKTEYKAKGRVEDAHEAIRPTHAERSPEDIKDSLSRDQFKLYKLVWECFVASQMSDAQYDTFSVKIKAGKFDFSTSGHTLKFKGFLAVYDKVESEEDENSKLPKLEINQKLEIVDINKDQHFTQPPAHYTEAMLVKDMEELGIGRPSTYAVTISNIVKRGYVSKENKVFYKTELGEIVNDIMTNNFKEIVDVDFTAKMENDLDKVEDGDIEWKDIIRTFYSPFEKTLTEAEENVSHIEIKDEETDIVCEECGRNMVIKLGRYGKFLACPGFPDCRNTKPYFEDAKVNCPKCGDKILIKKTKKGRKYFGCNNPECDFMSWNKPTGELCPRCGTYMVEKGSFKKRKVCCTNAECGYSKVVEETQEEQD